MLVKKGHSEDFFRNVISKCFFITYERALKFINRLSLDLIRLGGGLPPKGSTCKFRTTGWVNTKCINVRNVYLTLQITIKDSLYNSIVAALTRVYCKLIKEGNENYLLWKDF